MQRPLPPIALLTCAAVVAGCGSSTPTPSETAAVTTQATPTPVPTVAATPTPVPTPTPAIPCEPGQFEISINNQQGAAGTIFATFEIRNTTTSDCTENGYPKLQMLGQNGGELATSWSNDNSRASPSAVDLSPGSEPLGAAGATGHGYFLVSWSDASCSAAAATVPKFWQVTLPTSGFQTDVTATPNSDVCGGVIKIGPIKSAPYS
ncbi:MAG TPA: DUF4232 domain-containing protein [Candidatus Acidoferrales bacterium]|nr:DUF4232 domain-containing protein [Candidatus Acidoferrales bacterium]